MGRWAQAVSRRGRSGAAEPGVPGSTGSCSSARRLELEEEKLQPPAVERLGEIEAPTLVVTGELDHASVLRAGRAIAAATGAEQVEIEDVGHLPNLERPERLLYTIVPFLERHA